LRSSLVLLPLLVAACSGGDENAGDPLPPRERIFCSLNDAPEFTSDCTVERSEAEGRPVLVVRHPDGGFRRFELSRDNNGLITADGADEAGVAPNGTLLDVRVGKDRYRFPLEESESNAAAQ